MSIVDEWLSEDGRWDTSVEQELRREVSATLAARDAEIARLKALVEKRGYAMSWARQRIAEWHDLIESEADLDDSAGDAISVRDVVLKEMEDIRAGLLAAIDEACPEK